MQPPPWHVLYSQVLSMVSLSCADKRKILHIFTSRQIYVIRIKFNIVLIPVTKNIWDPLKNHFGRGVRSYHE